ncbi:efflux RND transporter periplasmic adaptor subunit [Massilia sp. IC2-476]|uniref:efflux RND transporter periplasmic adaptor subunit n=1 Tax=Massilia sp. IC2-476 TaxID=2887199 RepID=UPI001D117518|nr:efflux RND transporter periplasmic adaptor subunit [Massilia sp. IC2-476]MCC2970771.1 efflux RND transporter periplasmic adaptor subunit [Massilia sp. IC2-476]
MRSDHSSLSLTRVAAGTLVALALLSGCGKKDAAPAAGGPGGGMPAPEVGVITTKYEPVALLTELPARAEPIRTSQVRARVDGVVLKRLFTEGSVVKQGQSLFQIDPAPYQARLAAAQADVGSAQATLNQATALAERYKPLVEAQAVSKQEYTNALAAQKQAEAAVAAARAQVRIAQINTGYANVYAPISGRIGRALVTEGALVSATQATELALIQQTDSMYLNITQSASELQRLRKQAGGGADASVSVILDDGTELATKGRLQFSDITVDPSTGQVTLRATIANPDNALLPGQYVRVRLAQAQIPNGIVVPQQAVTRGGPQGDTLMVVGADNKPTPRTVKIGSQQGSNWVVTEGLKEGERVMVDGFQKLQMLPPGTPVKAVPWTASTSAAAPATAAAGAAAAQSAGQAPASAPSGSTASATPAAGTPRR